MNIKKKILFRVDASSSIGTGHIMRDLVLASQYDEEFEIIFATQLLEGNLNSKILESGYAVENLSSNSVEELDSLIKRLQIEMLVIDHYEIDCEFEKKLKSLNPKLTILSFDDTYEKHYCDILLNHNISAQKDRYKGLVPSYCELRCGEEYTLLREEFIEQKEKKNVFVAMGGSDHSNINTKVLSVLKTFEQLEIHIITTSANKNLEALQEFVEKEDSIELYLNSQKVAKLMRESDFAIVTPSVTLNEVVYMEVPFIAIKTAENQEDMYKYLIKKGYLALQKFDEKILHHKVKELLCKI